MDPFTPLTDLIDQLTPLSAPDQVTQIALKAIRIFHRMYDSMTEEVERRLLGEYTWMILVSCLIYLLTHRLITCT